MTTPTESEIHSLPAHVIACAERYKGINDRLRRLEVAVYLLLAVLVANGDGPLTKVVFAAFK